MKQTIAKYLSAFLMAFAAVSLVGCSTGPASRGVAETSEDAFITSKVKTAFAKDDHVKAIAINVDTYKGIVTLNGNVETQAVAIRAVDIARSTEGVKGVKSNLNVRG